MVGWCSEKKYIELFMWMWTESKRGGHKYAIYFNEEILTILGRSIMNLHYYGKSVKM